MGQYKLTQSKIDSLQEELAKLKNIGRSTLSEKLAELRTHTNIEDDEVGEVLTDQVYLEKRIAEIETILDDCEVIPEDVNTDVVSLGSEVRVGFEGYEDTFQIVSELEADPLNKKVSEKSPVGSALLGHKVGDTVTVDIGVVRRAYRILDIK